MKLFQKIEVIPFAQIYKNNHTLSIIYTTLNYQKRK